MSADVHERRVLLDREFTTERRSAVEHSLAGDPITLSLTFLTDRNKRESAVFAANRRLRRLGVTPAPVGFRPWADRAKVRAFDTWTQARGLIQRSASWRPC